MNESEIIRLADNGIECFAQIKALAQGQTPTPGPDPGPGPIPTPTPVPPAPPGVRIIDLPWVTSANIYTHQHGGFGENDVLAIRFTTGAVSTTNNLPAINAAEYDSPPSPRTACLSEEPGVFTPVGGAQGGLGVGPSITMPFAIGTGSGHGYYPVLKTNTTYYLNIKNNLPGLAGYNLRIDLVKVGGL